MRKTLLRLLLVAFAACTVAAQPTQSPATPAEIAPPVAPPRPHVVGSPHGSRNDPYYWLRDDTDRNSLLFKVDMAAGHGGRSGRFESLKETAEEYAFILHALGRRE